MDDNTSASNGDFPAGRSEASTKPLISIAIPVFIDKTYAELNRVAAGLDDYRFEFLFNDNHSTDSTFAKLSEIAATDPDVRVVRFARKNFGLQQSVLTGYGRENHATD